MNGIMRCVYNKQIFCGLFGGCYRVELKTPHFIPLEYIKPIEMSL